MNSIDYRLTVMFAPSQTGAGYQGLPQGDYNSSDYPITTTSASFAKPYYQADYPVLLFSVPEIKLLQAEAIMRYGVDNYNAARDMYQEAVKESFNFYGLGEDYYNPVLFGGGAYEFPSEGSEPEEFIKSISYQRWIALAHFQSLEAFFERNRTQYPPKSPVPYEEDGEYEPGDFTVSVNSVIGDTLPKRLPIPESEINRNKNAKNIEAKPVYQKVWWDKKQ
ncbi:MAG: SusD/RagB family nutrient-binding outer membrane lipoprotein [Bacteroidales bacterium]|nr:SusD/RagB family nutrient-binding outer membrane lipoprotein [Bacteroidales bacterium]